MKFPVWVHHVDHYKDSELAPDDSQHPFTEIYGKAADGLHLQATWDPHAMAISSIEDVIATDKMHATANGIEWKPWVVARGSDGSGGDGYARDEGRLFGEIAKAGAGPGEKPIVIIDLEPYHFGGIDNPQFWRGDLGAGPEQVRALITAFGATAGPGAEIWIAIDPREQHFDGVSAGEWFLSPIVTRVLPMTYFNDWLSRQATPEEARSFIANGNKTFGDSFGIEPGRIAHILGAPGAAGVLQDAINFCHELGNLKPSIWQRANLTQENADAIAEMPDPWIRQEVIGAPGTPIVDPDMIGQHIHGAGEIHVEKDVMAEVGDDLKSLEDLLARIERDGGDAIALASRLRVKLGVDE